MLSWRQETTHQALSWHMAPDVAPMLDVPSDLRRTAGKEHEHKSWRILPDEGLLRSCIQRLVHVMVSMCKARTHVTYIPNSVRVPPFDNRIVLYRWNSV